jgi:hypothetical protein
MLTTEENGAIPLVVGDKRFSVISLSVVLWNWVGPHEIADGAFEGDFIKSI